jgi:hypothetical protein
VRERERERQGERDQPAEMETNILRDSQREKRGSQRLRRRGEGNEKSEDRESSKGERGV